MKPNFALWAGLLFAVFAIGCSSSSSESSGASDEQSSQPPAATADPPTTVDEPPQEIKPPSERKQVAAIRSLYAAGKFDEAETAFDAALEAFPDSTMLKQLHSLAASYLMRGDRPQEAFTHWKAFTDDSLGNNVYGPRDAGAFGQRLAALASLADEIEGPPTADDIFDEYADRAADVASLHPEFSGVVTAHRAAYWAGNGRLDEARALVDELLTSAQEKLKEKPDNENAILGVADALAVKMRVEMAVDDGDFDTARDQALDFIFTQAKAHPTLSAIRSRFVNDHLMGANMLTYSDPEAAAVLLARFDQFENEVITPLNDEQLSQAWREERREGGMFDHVLESLEISRKQFALIGTPAEYPDNADGWVGVDEAITSDQLQGKVVLLDFFAVWCGPCIATFPHLRSWHDEFADEGLQVIGVSSYQSYGWDEENNRPMRVDNLEPAAERQAMQQFAEHHELPYAIAFTPDRQLQDHYVVQGIPHIVLIDRAGKVRLHRIGSGERNAAELEKAIKEALIENVSTETAPSETGG